MRIILLSIIFCQLFHSSNGDMLNYLINITDNAVYNMNNGNIDNDMQKILDIVTPEYIKQECVKRAKNGQYTAELYDIEIVYSTNKTINEYELLENVKNYIKYNYNFDLDFRVYLHNHNKNYHLIARWDDELVTSKYIKYCVTSLMLLLSFVGGYFLSLEYKEYKDKNSVKKTQ